MDATTFGCLIVSFLAGQQLVNSLDFLFPFGISVGKNENGGRRKLLFDEAEQARCEFLIGTIYSIWQIPHDVVHDKFWGDCTGNAPTKMGKKLVHCGHLLQPITPKFSH